MVVLPASRAFALVKIDPVVLFAICDAYMRRAEKQERVIGTLLGTHSDGVIDVKDSYVVPHNESSDQVAVDIVHHKTMFELSQRVSSTYAIVGWFSTGANVTSSDALIQDFYGQHAAHPIHLVVDTTLVNKKFDIKAYVSRALSLGDKVLATEFVELPCEVLLGDVERVGVDLLAPGTSAKPLADSDNLQTSLGRLQELISRASAYVDDVVAGRKVGDPAVGRYLADTLAVVPHFKREDFERLFNDNVQDVLLVQYLADLMRSQLALSEKLGTSALPIL